MSNGGNKQLNFLKSAMNNSRRWNQRIHSITANVDKKGRIKYHCELEIHSNMNRQYSITSPFLVKYPANRTDPPVGAIRMGFR